MNRSAPQFAGNNGHQAGQRRFPEFTGVAPRVSSRTYGSHRGGFVSIAVQPSSIDPNTLTMTGKCVVTGEPVELLDTNNNEISQMNEFVCYVDPATGSLVYYQHGTLNDDFDVDVYKKVVQFSEKYTAIF